MNRFDFKASAYLVCISAIAGFPLLFLVGRHLLIGTFEISWLNSMLFKAALPAAAIAMVLLALVMLFAKSSVARFYVALPMLLVMVGAVMLLIKVGLMVF